MGKVKGIKVVLDTNVVVSALLFGGVPGELVRMWKARKIRPLASREIVNEYLRLLTYPKFHLSKHEIEYLLYQEILPWFTMVDVERGPAFVRADPADDMFIWCASSGKAEAVVSGDEHLLRLRNSPITIISPEDFFKRFF